MKREVLLHPVAYLVLVSGLVSFVAYSFAVWPEPFLLRAGFVTVGVCYAVWGFWIHTRLKDLTANIMVEYLGAAGLAVALLWLITV